MISSSRKRKRAEKHKKFQKNFVPSYLSPFFPFQKTKLREHYSNVLFTEILCLPSELIKLITNYLLFPPFHQQARISVHSDFLIKIFNQYGWIRISSPTITTTTTTTTTIPQYIYVYNPMYRKIWKLNLSDHQFTLVNNIDYHDDFDSDSWIRMDADTIFLWIYPSLWLHIYQYSSSSSYSFHNGLLSSQPRFQDFPSQTISLSKKMNQPFYGVMDIFLDNIYLYLVSFNAVHLFSVKNHYDGGGMIQIKKNHYFSLAVDREENQFFLYICPTSQSNSKFLKGSRRANLNHEIKVYKKGFLHHKPELWYPISHEQNFNFQKLHIFAGFLYIVYRHKITIFPTQARMESDLVVTLPLHEKNEINPYAYFSGEIGFTNEKLYTIVNEEKGRERKIRLLIFSSFL